MTIYLIRHGETELNARRVVQVPETPLSARGIEQAARLAARIAQAGIRAILASDYARAAMTAERIAQMTGLPIAHEPLLRERHFGDLRGVAYDALEARGIDPFHEDYAPPAGETWDAFHARVDRAWQEVRRAATDCQGDLAVVTHGLVCHSIVRRHLGGSPDPNAALAFPNTSVTEIAGPPWRARVVGCAVHLDDTQSEGGGAD
jgi:broad specificity phosphatase PhoE